MYYSEIKTDRLPRWLKVRFNNSTQLHKIKKELRSSSLHTVCESAKCPNIGECFGRERATFLIMGRVCTRDCAFCAVEHGTPSPLDPDEPFQVAEMAERLNLKHVVITSVTRDDLPDGGASHFAATIRTIRHSRCHREEANGRRGDLPNLSSCVGLLRRFTPRNDRRIEVLTPDFNGDHGSIKTVLDAAPDVLNHNLETVERLTPYIRNKASYRRSLDVLKYAKRRSGTVIKSGMMVGLGETDEEVLATLEDLCRVGCDIVTIGQYLRPTRSHRPVKRFLEPERFTYYKEYGEQIGIKHVFSGPLVRSSYMAEEVYRLR